MSSSKATPEENMILRYYLQFHLSSTGRKVWGTRPEHVRENLASGAGQSSDSTKRNHEEEEPKGASTDVWGVHGPAGGLGSGQARQRTILTNPCQLLSLLHLWSSSILSGSDSMRLLKSPPPSSEPQLFEG